MIFSTHKITNNTSKQVKNEHHKPITFKGRELVDDTFEYQPINSHTLTNNKGYKVAINGAGSGKSIDPDNITITRGNNDSLRGQLGSFFYLREGSKIWSAGLQPTLNKPDKYETEFTDKKATITRQDGPIKTKLQVAIAPDNNVEERRLTLSSTDGKPHDIEITSYNETSLAESEGHPAFSKLFVETKYNPEIQGIIATRRPRGPHDKQICSVNTIKINKEDMAKGSKIEYETVREKFIGRTRNLQDPAAMHKKHLSNTAGIPLDPVASFRTTVHLEPNKEVNVDFMTISGKTETEIVELAKKYKDPQVLDRIINQESRGI